MCFGVTPLLPVISAEVLSVAQVKETRDQPCLAHDCVPIVSLT